MQVMTRSMRKMAMLVEGLERTSLNDDQWKQGTQIESTGEAKAREKPKKVVPEGSDRVAPMDEEELPSSLSLHHNKADLPKPAPTILIDSPRRYSDDQRGMSRIKQTSRKSTGGKAPRKALATKRARLSQETAEAGHSTAVANTQPTLPFEESQTGSPQDKSIDRSQEASSSESTRVHRLLLDTHLEVAQESIYAFRGAPLLRVRGTSSILRKLQELHDQAVEALEKQDFEAKADPEVDTK
ncbi:uncharacterized protein UTRI_10131 [Ustilago trichophora]|uniref:Uncharacterized protein n=1 Tax=Ustilago trichophora TaxID=86804 RepID=A0A5C3E2R6_9BASI|nr:uncharacterized protein UTRI_10131 [Ustilago trichophora]